MATVGELLASGTSRLRSSGSESARLDAELLLAFAIGVERTGVLAHPEAPVGVDAAAAFESAVRRREAGEPVAYIRGLKEFYGLAFGIDRRALIPRPETELLVAAAEREVRARLTAAPRPAGTSPLRVVDVGTGSGAIAIALAVLLRRSRMLGEVRILATDSSADALAVARENAVGHGIADAVTFVEADLLPGIVRPDALGHATTDVPPARPGPTDVESMDAGAVDRPPFDLVLSNLPYIPSAEVDRLPIAASFEPRSALDGGPDGLREIRRLIALLPAALTPDGSALLEIGFDQGPAAEALAEALPGAWNHRVELDLGGRPRLLRLDRLPLPAAQPAAGASR